MVVGRVSASVFTDIANAIRAQNGTAAKYRPSQMASAIMALDGDPAGEAGVEPYGELGEGVVSSKVFESIAEAIRAKGGLAAKYRPPEMAAAIRALDLRPDVGLKPRAVLTDDWVLEFNYREERRSFNAAAKILAAWEVSADGYASAAARPWDAVKGLVERVVIDDTFPQSGITSCAYWFTGFSALLMVGGFDYLAGMTDATQLFNGCSQLLTIYAVSFDNSSIAKSAGMFYGCTRLVGGADGFVPSPTSGASVCKIGDGGVLTHPGYDRRSWFSGDLFADGELVLSAGGVPSAAAEGRQRLASGPVCANARYNAVQCTPWAGLAKQVSRVTISEDLAWMTRVNMNYWFYGCLGLVSVAGLGNLHGVASMLHAFNSCTSLEVLDLRGLDPSGLADVSYAFGGCSALRTILVDADWALPAVGVSGMGTFASCKALVGGAGTAFDASRVGFAMMRVDWVDGAGYLTAG